MHNNRWMLPDGMEEGLPPVSWRVEGLRRKLLDHYRAEGYQLMLPPLVEHLDALLTGAASDLERQTFRFSDPASGRMLGIRADMTPQAARIAARHFPQQKIVRLCYFGTVLRTAPDSPGGSRSPRQVGCELFGEPALDADLEVIQTMLGSLELAGVTDVHLDLGHVGIYRAVIARLNLDAQAEAELFGILQRKSLPDLQELERARGLDGAAARLAALMDLNGDVTVLQRARASLAPLTLEIEAALGTLEQVAQQLARLYPHLPIHIDLAELRGLRYHTGLVFAAFVAGYGREIARGGRYDGVGGEFGRAMPATGFSADMNELLRLGAE